MCDNSEIVQAIDRHRQAVERQTEQIGQIVESCGVIALLMIVGLVIMAIRGCAG